MFSKCYVLLVAVLEALGAGAVHCGGSSVGTAVEVEVDGAKKINQLLFEKRIICDCVIAMLSDCNKESRWK